MTFKEITDNPWLMGKTELFHHIRKVIRMYECKASGWFQGNHSGSDLVECRISTDEGATITVDGPKRELLMALVQKPIFSFSKSRKCNVRGHLYALQEIALYHYVELMLNMLADFDEDWLFTDEGGRIYFSFGEETASWEIVKVQHQKKLDQSLFYVRETVLAPYTSSPFAGEDGAYSWENYGGIWFDDGDLHEWVEDSRGLSEKEAISLAYHLNSISDLCVPLTELDLDRVNEEIEKWEKKKMTETTMHLIDYCLGFYGDGPDSLRYLEDWGQQPMTSSEILAVLPHVEEVYPKEVTNGIPVNVDSFLREVVRDFVLAGRGVDYNFEHFTSKEEREIFTTNADDWRDQLESLREEKELSGKDMGKIWAEIIAPSKVKPRWFGFLNN